MTADSTPSPPISDDAEPRTLTEKILKKLRRDIISGTFAAGDRIKAEHLKERYEVGTSPIREALFQLVSDGLVRADAQRGFRIAEMNHQDLLDIADWRVRLESEALKRSIERGDVNWEANAIVALHKLKKVEMTGGYHPRQVANLWEDQHRAFHFSLYSACDSPWLLKFCDVLIQHGERYRRLYMSYPSVAASIISEHQQLLDAAIERDATTAVSILARHIKHAAELALPHIPGIDKSLELKVSQASVAGSGRKKRA